MTLHRETMNKLLGIRELAISDLGKQASIKDSPWFWPGVGGAAGVLLSTPEIIDDMKENKARAIRRFMLSAGLGMGVGYVGDKVINRKQGIMDIVDSLKSQYGLPENLPR